MVDVLQHFCTMAIIYRLGALESSPPTKLMVVGDLGTRLVFGCGTDLGTRLESLVWLGGEQIWAQD